MECTSKTSVIVISMMMYNQLHSNNILTRTKVLSKMRSHSMSSFAAFIRMKLIIGKCYQLVLVGHHRYTAVWFGLMALKPCHILTDSSICKPASKKCICVLLLKVFTITKYSNSVFYKFSTVKCI